MAEYQSPEDMRFAKALIDSAPAEAEAFFKLKSVTERSNGVIPAKYRELIALAVALTTQCSYCLDSHTRNAAKARACYVFSGGRRWEPIFLRSRSEPRWISGPIRAGSDEEIGKIGPSPPGCGENGPILRCRPRLGIAKAFVLRLVCAHFHQQRRPPEKT